MAKNMYQKREERKQNRLNNDEQGGFKKTVINCEIVVYTNYLEFA
jgi:hypothetical protein